MTAATKAIIILTAIVVVESVILYNCLEARIYMRQQMQDCQYKADLATEKLRIFDRIWEDNYKLSMEQGKLQGRTAEGDYQIGRYHDALHMRELPEGTHVDDKTGKFAARDGKCKKDKQREAYLMAYNGMDIDSICRRLGGIKRSTAERYIRAGQQYYSHFPGCLDDDSEALYTDEDTD